MKNFKTMLYYVSGIVLLGIFGLWVFRTHLEIQFVLLIPGIFIILITGIFDLATPVSVRVHQVHPTTTE